MNNYTKILVAVDLSEHASALLSQAKSIASRNEAAELHIAYCIEPLQYQFFGEFPVDLTDIQAEIEKSATEKLKQLATEAKIADGCSHLLVGNLQDEICAFIKQYDVDLLVVGKHHKHGLSLMLGSTCESMLSRTQADVLAVNIKEA